MTELSKLLKQLFCKHTKTYFLYNIYGDQINLFDARSKHRCLRCGKTIFKQTLHNP